MRTALKNGLGISPITNANVSGRATVGEMLVLLSWAVFLSGYPTPSVLPIIQYESHEFFVENACNGRECKVFGLYQDDGIIHIDEAHKEDTSLVVHELTHFLQDKDMEPCAREREAYAVQQEYIIQVLASVRMVRPKACKQDTIS